MAFNLTVLLAFLYLASNERSVAGLPSGIVAREEGPWVGIGIFEEDPIHKWNKRGLTSGVGALSDMQTFFESLRNNLDYLETLPLEEREVLLGKAPSAPEREVASRPTNSAAYLHALRNQRPSYKIRNFVDSSEPASLRGTNRYDPNLLWTGLGKRR
ncbi:uncharacterized protein [Halyomorpha halys]|uniref:uncharacterized protein isoform X2 n=1 Tax=Halyomorpha halys TaxID=286706 RepID=UPI0006D4E92A|nr:uncharacterized protein LOC106680965 isoform X2 [Halyomorpha halys]